MQRYRDRGFRFYEVGTRWFGPQRAFVPSSKELSIGVFKERYGGELWPELEFEKYYDRDLFARVEAQRLARHVAAGIQPAIG
jgi:hypothetical protein